MKPTVEELEEQLIELCAKGQISEVRRTLVEHPDTLRVSRRSADVLSAAIRGIHSKVLRVLKPVPDRDAVDAVVRKGLPLLRLLLDSGADPDSLAVGDLPPVHVATQLPTTLVLELLLEHGADMERLSGMGKAARDYAHYPFVKEWFAALSH